MSATQVTVTLNLQDELSRAMRRAGDATREATRGMSKSFENVQDSLKNTRKKLDNFGGGLQSIGGKMSLAITAPITAGGFAMFKAAADAEESRSLFETIFGDMTDNARSWADSYADQVGRSRQETQNTVSQVANLAVGFGMTGDEAFKLAKGVTEASTDLASFNNLSEEYARGNMMSALQGNHSAAVGLGAVLNENTLDLAKNSMGIERNWKELTEAEKVQVRYEAIMMQNVAAMGDATRTADSTANQMKALRGRVHDLSIELGNELIPIGRDLIDVGMSIIDRVRDMAQRFKALDDQTRANIIKFVGFIAIMGPVLVVIGTAIKALSIIIGAFLGVIKVVGIVVAVFKGLTIVGIIMGAKILLIVGIIAAVVGALIWLWRNSDLVRDKLGQAWDWISNKTRDVFGSMGGFIQGFVGSIWGIGGQIFSALISPFLRAQSFIGSIAGNIGRSISNAIPAGVRRFIPGFASGGLVTPQSFATGGLVQARVGERGPEEVILPTGSRVVRASDTRRNEESRGETVININVTAGMGADGNQIADMIRQVINQDQRLARLI